MADINEYLDGLDIKFSEQEKQLADIFAESWEYCREHSCENCEYKPKGKNNKMLLCLSCQYAKRLIAADVAPVRHAKWELIDECINEGVYCSNCHKKIYRAEYANQKVKSNFCPNCGAKMDEE